ncbi:MAG: TolB family protein [Deltaproteobacteria bacterium]|nr:TolB family protein [Deltaproteobacteria bacterium]
MKLAVFVVAAVAALPTDPSARGDPAPPAEGEPVSEFRRLTKGPGLDAMPSWSPDGRRIVFHARRPAQKGDALPTRKIWIIDRDGRNERRLSDGAAEEYHPVFSPDGSRIAFVSEANGSRDVWLMDADGKNPLPLTDDPGLEDHPCWSPDGSRLAYVALPKDGGNFDLWIMNADGSGKRKVTFTAANEVFPAWHPQGHRIALASDVNGNFDLYTVSLPDEKLAPLVTGPSNDTRPAWSPDGTKIAFTRWPGEGRSRDATLWIANADGSVPTEIAVAAPAAHPSWASDGRTLAFQRASEGDWNLWSARLPEDVVKEGRLRLARQVRGRRGEDLVKLRRGETIYGAVATARFRLRAPYGLVELPRAALASLQFDDMAKGTAKIVLGNGDTFSGLLLDDDIALDGAGGRQHLRKEKIEAIGFRLDSGDAGDRSGPARLLMRNGDSYSAAPRTRGLRLRVGSQTVELPLADVARVEFAEEGKKSQVITRKGDTLAGTLETPLLEVDLPAGAYLGLYPSYIRSLTLAEGSP